jgi:hypothetical protein
MVLLAVVWSHGLACLSMVTWSCSQVTYSNIGNLSSKITVKYGRNQEKMRDYDGENNLCMVCAHISKYSNIDTLSSEITVKY